MLRKFLIRPEIVQNSTIMKQSLTSQTFRIAYHMVHAKQCLSKLTYIYWKEIKIQIQIEIPDCVVSFDSE